MIVISRKRILFIASILCVSVFAFSLNTYSSKKAIETVALPVSNKVIVIDAGHGKPDERNSLLTLKNNIDLLQKIKCFKHFIFFMLKRRLIYAKQRIW